MNGNDEAAGRLAIASQSYTAWGTNDLWEEYILLTDEAWEGRDSEQGPQEVPWAKREAIGLALIDRGVTAAELIRGYPNRT